MWNTRLAGPLDLADAMITVQLPPEATDIAPTLMTTLAQEHNIQTVVYQQKDSNVSSTDRFSALFPSPHQEVPNEVSSNSGSWWMRLSAQVYTELSDFERVGKLVLEMCGKSN